MQLTILLVLALYSYVTNKDVFSPVKWYIATIFVFFGAIFWKEYPVEIHVTYFLFLILGFVFSFIEKNKYLVSCRLHPVDCCRNYAKKWWLIWMLSIPSLIAQIYLIHIFDGLSGYVTSIDLRVVQWSGLGFWLMLIGFSKPLSLVYFSIGLISRKPMLSAWWLGFFLHLSVVITLNILSGGRGKFLGIFIAMLVAYHYLMRPLKLKFVLSSGVIILVVAMLMGVARSGLTWTDDGVRTGFDYTDRVLDTHMFSYGLWPLDILYRDTPDSYGLGITYLVGLTNLVPSQLWVDKPKSGGVVLTEIQRGEDYVGTSHITPGAIGEAIINFGNFAGVIIGSLILIASFLLSISIYRKFLRARGSGRDVLLLFGLYFYLYEIPASLVKGEFANLLTTKIIAICMLIFVILLLDASFNWKKHADKHSKM